MKLINKMLLSFLVVLGSNWVQAQDSNILSQKVDFRQNSLAIGEILKVLIHNKKVNLSYSPEALNLKTVIQLPSREMVIRDVLYLIGFKTGNRVVFIGSQVIIKKDKYFTNQEAPKARLEPERKTENIVVMKDSVYPSIVPKSIAAVKTIGTTPPIFDLTKMGLKAPVVTEIPIVKPPVKKVKKSTLPPMFSWKRLSIEAGAGAGIAFLSDLKDSGQVVTASPKLCWQLQTDVNWWFAKNMYLETGITYHQKNFSVKSNFHYPILADTSFDSTYYQKVDLRLNSIEVPVCINYAFKIQNGTFNIGIGGYFQYAINGKRTYSTNINSNSVDVKWGMPPATNQNLASSLMYVNRTDYGILGQVGYQFNRLKLEFNARIDSKSLSSFESGKTKQFTLSVVYQILAKN